jgi:chlorobactene glucosyltransferase
VAYALAGPGVWAVFGFGMYKGRRRLQIRVKPVPVLQHYPQVTVIVPCRNEQRLIESCVKSILAQDYPDIQVIVVNDRSTDATGQIIDQLAASDARLTALHIRDGELPAGWLGKPNAARAAVEHSTGDWLIFIDSDCTLAPQAVREAIVTGEHRQFDLVSFIPRFIGTGFWDSLMTPLCGMTTSAMFGIMYANSTMRPQTAFACGQFIAIRKTIYHSVGGHAAVKDTAGEDVQLARLVKRAGHRPRLGWGLDLVHTTMYGGLREVLRGWGRNFIAASRGKPWRVLGVMAFMCISIFSIIPTIISQNPQLLWLAALHALMMTVLLGIGYYQADSHPWRALLWPMSMVMLLVILCRSLHASATGRVSWRGQSLSIKK